MLAPTHLAINTVLSVPVAYFVGLDWQLVLLFISFAVLIDIDHILYFIFAYGDLTPRKWIVRGNKKRDKMEPGLYIFHSPEFNLILFLLSFFNQIVLLMLISNMIHLSLDIFDHYRYHKNFLWMKRWSIVYSLTRKHL